MNVLKIFLVAIKNVLILLAATFACAILDISLSMEAAKYATV